MRESVIDVLFYLFDDLLPGHAQAETDLHQMAQWLDEAGFSNEDIDRAMQWFYELSLLVGTAASTPDEANATVRVFSPEECRLLSPEARDYLIGLWRCGALDHVLLEKVIERLMALEEELDIAGVRWVTALVVLNIYNGELPPQTLAAFQEEWLYPSDHRVIH